MGDRNSFSFKDKGAIVNILVPVSHDRSEDKPVCESKTTSLSLTWPDGQSILKVAQLYGTIDASKTSCERKDNSILVTLHKLGTDKWSSLEASEGKQTDLQESEESSDSANPGNALATREKVQKLFEAALEGKVEEVLRIGKELSPEGLSKIKDAHGRNALHFAAVGGQEALTRQLIEKEGMDVNAQDEEGETALGLAAAASHLPVIKALLSLKANVELTGEGQARPLHRASATGSAEVVRTLLEAGADKEANSVTGTPLLWAAGSGNFPALRELLNFGVNVNAVSSDGCSAVLMAAAGGEGKTVEALLEKGADPNLKAEGGVTALHAASEMGNLSAVQALIKAGADPNLEDSEGAKPIIAAASSGHRDIVEFLFPLTKSSGQRNWSTDGLMAETSSASEASPSGKPSSSGNGSLTRSEEGERLKREGNEAFVAKDFLKARAAYTQALSHDPNDHIVWCNRSGANLRMGDSEAALSDAQRSRALKSDYSKAWFREGEAAKALNLWEDAALAYYEAFQLNPKEDRLAREFQAAIEEGRKQHKAKEAQ